MEQRFIKLTKENYKQYLPIDTVAFSFSEAGAMGEAGAVALVSSNKQLFSFNYVYGGFEMEEVGEICPVLRKCRVSNFKVDVPKEFVHLYLGFGNHLVIKDILFDEFKVHAKDSIDSPDLLYETWLEAILKALNNFNYLQLREKRDEESANTPLATKKEKRKWFGFLHSFRLNRK